MKTFGTVTFNNHRFALTSEDYAHRIEQKMPKGRARVKTIEESFLGDKVKVLLSREGKIVGWDERAVNKHQNNVFRA